MRIIFVLFFLFICSCNFENNQKTFVNKRYREAEIELMKNILRNPYKFDSIIFNSQYEVSDFLHNLIVTDSLNNYRDAFISLSRTSNQYCQYSDVYEDTNRVVTTSDNKRYFDLFYTQSSICLDSLNNIIEFEFGYDKYKNVGIVLSIEVPDLMLK